MNPSDWIYHLSLRTMVNESGLLDPCAAARPPRRSTGRAPRARRAAAAGLALIPTLLAMALLLSR